MFCVFPLPSSAKRIVVILIRVAENLNVKRFILSGKRSIPI